MAQHRHKRVTNARLKPKAALVVAPIATVATLATVSIGTLSSSASRDSIIASAGGANLDGALPGAGDALLDRGEQVSRNESRAQAAAEQKAARKAALARQAELKRQATLKAIKNAKTKLWTTDALNIWSTSAKDARLLGELDAGERVLVTGRHAGGRDEIVLNGKSRWVTSGYLSEDEPLAGISTAPCANGTSVASGVNSNIVAVHRAVCALFPEISTYGTFRGDGEHAQGIAVDIMVSGGRGWEVAEYLRENYAELGINYIIYSQRIWSVERSGEGWRGMSDRGSVTANHYDHVHVTTNF